MQKNILLLSLLALCSNTLIKSFDEDFDRSEKNKLNKTKVVCILGTSTALAGIGYYLFQKYHGKPTITPPQPTTATTSQHNNWFELLLKTIGAGHSTYQYLKQRQVYPEQTITFRPLDSTTSVTKSVAGIKFIYYTTTGLIKYKVGEAIGKKIDTLYQP